MFKDPNTPEQMVRWNGYAVLQNVPGQHVLVSIQYETGVMVSGQFQATGTGAIAIGSGDYHDGEESELQEILEMFIDRKLQSGQSLPEDATQGVGEWALSILSRFSSWLKG